MKYKKLPLVFIILSLGLFGGIFTTVIHFGFEQNNDTKMFNPKLSYSTTLDYDEYTSISASGGSGDRFYWEFSGSNSFVGITVRAMDSTEYADFVSSQSYTYYSLSDGGFYVDSGNFYPTYTSTWHIVFINWDSDVQSTLLTYSGTVYSTPPPAPPAPPPIGLIIGIVVGIIAAIAVAGFLVYRYQKKKREHPIVPITPIAPVPGYTAKTPSSIPYTKIAESVKKVFEVASGNRIDLEMLRDAVPMNKQEFNNKVLDLAKDFGFKIEVTTLHITDEKRDAFINALLNALR